MHPALFLYGDVYEHFLLEFLGFAYREIELARGRRSRHSIVN